MLAHIFTMNKTHQDLENELKSILQSGPLASITLHQVNDNFFELDDDGFWVIEGIEFTFQKGIVSAAYSTKLESYVIESKPLTEIYEYDNGYILENENISKLTRYLGLNIIDVRFESLEFEFVVDYTMQTATEKRLVQMILEFQNTSIIQIAFVTYSLIEDRAPSNFSYDLQSELLVSTKNIIEIAK